MQGYVPEIKMNLAGAPGLEWWHFSSGRLNRRPRWFQVAAVDGSVGPGWPDPPAPQRSWQFGTLVVSKPGSLSTHIFAYCGPFWGAIYIPQSNVQIGSVWLDGF